MIYICFVIGESLDSIILLLSLWLDDILCILFIVYNSLTFTSALLILGGKFISAFFPFGVVGEKVLHNANSTAT